MTQLRKYFNHTFDDHGGVVSDDYKTFERKYINYLKRLCRKNGWTFVKAHPNHYEFSAVIRRWDMQHIYISISDVRHWRNGWCNSILVRTMKHDKDWTGGRNDYCSLEELENLISKIG